jgi:hypothetical protein
MDPDYAAHFGSEQSLPLKGVLPEPTGKATSLYAKIIQEIAMSYRHHWLPRFLLILCFSCGPWMRHARAGATTGSACEVEPEERVVYIALLPSLTNNSPGWRTILVDSTDSSHFAREFSLGSLLFRDLLVALHPQLMAAPSGSISIFASAPPGVLVLPKGAVHQLMDDYNNKLASSCKIGRLPVQSKKFYMIRGLELRAIFTGVDPQIGWKRFHARFTDNADIVSLSRVAFDKSHSIAIVCTSSAIAANAAGGSVFVLRREKEGWIVVRSYATWVT